MTEYVFAEHDDDQELARMRLIEAALDGTTTELLGRSGIGPNGRCLELGAGAGSVMRWMGETVGRTGRVVGVDRNTSHLRRLTAPPYELVEGDFLTAPLEGPFDVAHCRYVLIHNVAGDEMLRTLGRLLRPGGTLVVEEPDFTSALLLNPKAPESLQRVHRAVCRTFERRNLDPRFGLDLPEKVAATGLQILDVVSHLHLARGGSPMARLMAASATSLEGEYVDTGEATSRDVEEYVRRACDDRYWTTYYATVSVVASKSP